jgi:hypothetical protein
MTRSNVAVGIESEGFSAACELPPVKPEPVIASAS